MDSRTTSPATRSRSTSTTCGASSVPHFITNVKGRGYRVDNARRAERPWSLRRRMAIAAAAAACSVFLLLGLLVYRAVATSTAAQFDELLQQQAALALRYADHEYDEGDSVVPARSTTAARAHARSTSSTRSPRARTSCSTARQARRRRRSPSATDRVLQHVLDGARVARVLAELRHNTARSSTWPSRSSTATRCCRARCARWRCRCSLRWCCSRS